MFLSFVANYFMKDAIDSEIKKNVVEIGYI